MKASEINDILNKTYFNEVRKRILSESEGKKKEVYHIKMDGEPIATFNSKKEAEESLPKYKAKSKGELIIEKCVYESYGDMIEKLDQMGQELEETEGINSYDFNEEEEEMDCNECKEKKRKLRLKESEMISFLRKIVKESIPEITKKAQAQSKKDNEANSKEVAAKIKKSQSFNGNDNPEFPKPIGKGEKVARKNTKEQEETIADFRGGGMEDLNYDYEPSEQFKKRLKMAIEGHSSMGNSHDAANVVKSNLGKDIQKKVERKKKKVSKEMEVRWGHDWKSTGTSKSLNESKDDILKDIEKMKKITFYNKNTQ